MYQNYCARGRLNGLRIISRTSGAIPSWPVSAKARFESEIILVDLLAGVTGNEIELDGKKILIAPEKQTDD